MPTLLRTNECGNPNIESNLNGYTLANEATISRILDSGMSGNYLSRITYTGSTISDSGLAFGGVFTPVFSSPYCVSLDIKASTTRILKLSAQGPGVINQELSNISLVAGVKQRVVWNISTQSIPDVVALYLLRTDINLGTVDTDSFLIEKGSVAKSYFDGNTPNTAFKQYAWLGPTNGSPSTESSVLSRPASEYSATDIKYEFFSRQSGLSSGSMSDHQYKYYKDLLGLSGISLTDLEFIHFKNQSGLSSGSISDFKAKFYADNGGSEREYYQRNFV